MELDLSALKRAIAQVDEALTFTSSDLAQANERVALQFRASSIQAFEYTYELTYKTLLRYLEIIEPSEIAFRTMSFQQVIRLGYERELLQCDLRAWLRFRESRNATSHTYNDMKAQEVFAQIPHFVAEAKYLLNEVMKRQ